MYEEIYDKCAQCPYSWCEWLAEAHGYFVINGCECVCVGVCVFIRLHERTAYKYMTLNKEFCRNGAKGERKKNDMHRKMRTYTHSNTEWNETNEFHIKISLNMDFHFFLFFVFSFEFHSLYIFRLNSLKFILCAAIGQVCRVHACANRLCRRNWNILKINKSTNRLKCSTGKRKI